MSYNTTHLALSLMLICLIAALLLVIAVQALEPKGAPTCTSFSSHIDAQRAYEKGANRLDGDADGIACESLLRK